jgi:hypothetical protein
MNDNSDPRILAYALEHEAMENKDRLDTDAIRLTNGYNSRDGFTIVHKYSNKALAIESVSWHVTGAECVCIPVAGIHFEYLQDGSITAEIHCLAGTILETAASNFLSHQPRAEAFSKSSELLSERRRIAAIAAEQHWDRFAHVGSVIRNALTQEAEWAFPDLVQPCSSFHAQNEIKTEKARTLAQIAMIYLRHGLRKGGDK